MATIGIFYGSDSGNMKEAAEILHTTIGEANADLYDVAKDPEDKLVSNMINLSLLHLLGAMVIYNLIGTTLSKKSMVLTLLVRQ